MTLWRISNHPTLDGAGGLSAPGRWHTAGQRIVYYAPNPATALLEVLVHAKIDIEDIPVNLRYLEIEAPDTLAVQEVDLTELGRSWRTDLAATRAAGDEWLRDGRTALLRVPSVIGAGDLECSDQSAAPPKQRCTRYPPPQPGN